MHQLSKFVTGILAALLFAPAFVAAQVEGSTVVLQAGGITVTAEDIDRYIEENVPPEKRSAVVARPDIFREMAESLYIMRTLAAEAEKSDGFDHEQAAWGADMVFKRRLVNEYRIAYVKEVLKNANWEASAMDVYKADPEAYKTPERVKASHILIKTETRSDEEARSLASKLRDRALAGEDFAALALQFSEDGSAKANGR